MCRTGRNGENFVRGKMLTKINDDDEIAKN